MTLASMHPTFQVSIKFCNLSSPNSAWKSTFIYNYACKAKVAITQRHRVKIARVLGIWKCLLEGQESNPSMFVFANWSQCNLWHAISEWPSLWRVDTLQSTFLWSAKYILFHFLKKIIFFDSQNGIWQVLKTSILNTVGWCVGFSAGFLYKSMGNFWQVPEWFWEPFQRGES